MDTVVTRMTTRRRHSFVYPKHVSRECQRYVTRQELGPNNQLVTVHEIVTYHPSDFMANYNVSDFSIVNMQSSPNRVAND